MESSRDFTSVRLQEVLKELDDMRAIYREQSLRLERAEAVLNFYGSPKTYGITRREDDTVFQDRLLGDFSDTDHPKTKVGGARARLYFTEREKQG